MSTTEEHDDALGQIFSAHLQKLRTERGISQEALADEAGLHRTYVGLVERALRTPTLIAIHRLANALGVPARDLLPPLSATHGL